MLQTEYWLFPLLFPEVPEDEDDSELDPKKPKKVKDI